MLGGTRQRLKLLRMVYAAESTTVAFDRGDLAARAPEGRTAIEDLREALHVLRYELPELQLTPHQQIFLKTIAALCPDPECTGQCSRGWRRFLAGKDLTHARKLASAGLVITSEGKSTAAHVTPLGRTFAAAAASRGEHGDRRRYGDVLRRASSLGY